jgi:transcriptional regulator with XRE-family HTH domain
MSYPINTIHQRIKDIRLSRNYTLEECANHIGVDKETYEQFEEGHTSLSMAEIELLAMYLSIPTRAIFEADAQFELEEAKSINIKNKDQFKALRLKMIQSMLVMEKQKQNKKFKEINKATDIPTNTLKDYFNGTTPIPLDDLDRIKDALDIPFEQLTLQVEKDDFNATEDQGWAPEFPEVEQVSLGEMEIEDPYSLILEAFKHLPLEEQAKFVKSLLVKLKS